MWILTVVLLLYGGDVRAISTPTADYSLSGARCHAMAYDAMKARQAGFHVVSATYERYKEA